MAGRRGTRSCTGARRDYRTSRTNADVGANGQIRALVVAEDGRAIDGFGEDGCRPLCENSTRSRIGWCRNETLSGLKDRYLRLVFHLRCAKLYPFWIE